MDRLRVVRGVPSFVAVLFFALTLSASNESNQTNHLMESVVRLGTVTGIAGSGVLVKADDMAFIVSNRHVFDGLNGQFVTMSVMQDGKNGKPTAVQVTVQIREIVTTRAFDNLDDQPVSTTDNFQIVIKHARGTVTYQVVLAHGKNNLRGLKDAISEMATRGLPVQADFGKSEQPFRLHLYYINAVNDPDSAIELLNQGVNMVSTRALWKHPNESKLDIAVLPFTGSEKISLRKALSYTEFPTRDEFDRLSVQPSQKLLCMGYPFGFAGPAGGPLLRPGMVASAPPPASDVEKKVIVSAPISPGDSGGICVVEPSDRAKAPSILGIITDELVFSQEVATIYDQGRRSNRTGFGSVTAGFSIREFIESMVKQHPSTGSQGPNR